MTEDLHASQSLPRRSLGRTGLSVTRLGLGLAAVGRPAYITPQRSQDLGPERSVEDLQRRTHDLLDGALAAGVGYIDTARSYGRGEEFLSRWLRRRDIAPGTVTVGTKWGYTYVGDWRLGAEVHEVKDHSLATLRRQYAESRALLGDHLALLQIHSATRESGVLQDRRVLADLQELGETGLTIGLTTSGPQQADTILEALDVEVDGVNPFRCVQATWNLLEGSAGTALAEAHDAGWGIIVKEVLANGRLASEGDAPEEVVTLAGELGIGLDTLAFAVAHSQPWADVVLSGAVTRAQLEAGLRSVAVSLAPDHLDRLARLVETPEQYWRERSELPWR